MILKVNEDHETGRFFLIYIYTTIHEKKCIEDYVYMMKENPNMDI